MQPAHHKDPHAAELDKPGGQKRMEQLNAQEYSALAKHAARTCWHLREAQAARDGLRKSLTSSNRHEKTASSYPSSDTGLEPAQILSSK